jgi:hypothetical protein
MLWPAHRGRQLLLLARLALRQRLDNILHKPGTRVGESAIAARQAYCLTGSDMNTGAYFSSWTSFFLQPHHMQAELNGMQPTVRAHSSPASAPPPSAAAQPASRIGWHNKTTSVQLERNPDLVAVTSGAAVPIDFHTVAKGSGNFLSSGKLPNSRNSNSTSRLHQVSHLGVR